MNRQERRAEYKPMTVPAKAALEQIAKDAASDEAAGTWAIVPMDEVPAPPSGICSNGRYTEMYRAIKKLPQGFSLRVPTIQSKKELSYMKTQLRVMAAKDKKMLLSSRNENSTVAWFWLAPLADSNIGIVKGGK